MRKTHLTNILILTIILISSGWSNAQNNPYLEYEEDYRGAILFPSIELSASYGGTHFLNKDLSELYPLLNGPDANLMFSPTYWLMLGGFYSLNQGMNDENSISIMGIKSNEIRLKTQSYGGELRIFPINWMAIIGRYGKLDLEETLTLMSVENTSKFSGNSWAAGVRLETFKLKRISFFVQALYQDYLFDEIENSADFNSFSLKFGVSINMLYNFGQF